MKETRCTLPNEKIEEIRQLIYTAQKLLKADPATHPPGFMFRVKQWLGDNNVMLMDWDARGMHMHFMCISWQQNPPGTLPDDDSKLRRWAHNHAEWDRLKSQIFSPDPHQSSWKLIDGMWVQEALIKEFIRQAEYRLTRKRAAKKRWKNSTSDAYAYPHEEQKQYSDVPNLHPSVRVQCLDNTPSPSEKELPDGSSTSVRKKRIESSTPGDVKPSGFSPPNEDESIGSSPSKEVKPIESSQSDDVKTSEQRKDSRKQTRTHPRLEVFMEEYLRTMENEYVVGNYAEEGGAAKRTVSKIADDHVYRLAVRAFLECDDRRIKENGYLFLWFIRELNRWVQKAKDSINANGTSKYDDIYE